MNNLQKSLLIAVCAGVGICLVPVAGAVIGASVAANGAIGAAAGFILATLALPVPIAVIKSRQPDAGKNRLQRLLGTIGGMYGAVFRKGSGAFKRGLSALRPQHKRGGDVAVPPPPPEATRLSQDGISGHFGAKSTANPPPADIHAAPGRQDKPRGTPGL